jgi:argininosuccinate lyase
MAVEPPAELIGPAAGRLHTARSRNDQVATDFRCGCAAPAKLDEALADACSGAGRPRRRACGTIMPGFTHLQVAQPVTLGHHLLAYVEMLRATCRASPRAGAGRGVPARRRGAGRHRLPDRPPRDRRRARLRRPTANSLDSVSDRDFALDYLSAAAQCSLHLSRLAEELIIWASPPFGFVQLSDQWSTGSRSCRRSATPTRPSWCAAIRGGSSACSPALMVTMKGLPLAYSKDMQDDKAPTFEAHDLLMLSLAALAGMVESATFNPSGCAKPRRRASPPPPTSPTGWSAKPACRSARRTTSPAAR